MSNKLIKNKNSTSKELEYYKNHCALLEKELEEERKKRTGYYGVYAKCKVGRSTEFAFDLWNKR